MAQLQFDELGKTPVDFLEEITDKEFLETINGTALDQNQQKSAQSKPAEPPEFSFDPQQPPQAGPGGFDQPGGTRVNVKEIVSGELATELMDKILPVLLSLGADRFLDMDVPKRAFTLTASEKSTVAPIMEKCLSQLNINFDNPFIALAVSLGFIYGSKFIDVANNPEYKKKVQAAKQKVERTAAAVHGEGIAYSADGRKLTRKPGENRGRKPKEIIFK